MSSMRVLLTGDDEKGASLVARGLKEEKHFPHGRRRPRPVRIVMGTCPDSGTCNQFLLKLVRVPKDREVRVPDLID
jgi:hypothetical protein